MTESWSALFKHKPIIHPAVESFEILLDEHPIFNGSEEMSGGTDLSGTISLTLGQPLANVTRIVVILHGLRRSNSSDGYSQTSLPSPNIVRSTESSSAISGAATIGRSGISKLDDRGESILIGEKEVYKVDRNSPSELPAGVHDWRFYFKLPGNLPKTVSGEVAYTLRAIVQQSASAVSPTEGISDEIECVEEVIIRRVVPQGLGSDPVPSYFQSNLDAEVKQEDEPPAYF
ncbi:hypothetical protein HK098_000012 [Nowakowskiella sp. JEL0407]|nr:hypothetical protein HK098_000012 [Nowakowskiella sp. JEL0407]